MTNDTLLVNNQSDKFGNGTNCSSMPGYQLRFIYLYDARYSNSTTAFQTGMINNQINITLVPELSDLNGGTFRI